MLREKNEKNKIKKMIKKKTSIKRMMTKLNTKNK